MLSPRIHNPELHSASVADELASHSRPGMSEIRRWRRLEADQFGAERVMETETPRVESLPLQTDHRGAAIGKVSEQGMPERRQVHPDLVRATGLEPATQSAHRS